MSSTVLCAVTLLACALTFGAAQTSCKGRCGAEYYRGNMCQCDYGCLEYGECCRDYESQCTTKNSCKGRCGERFKRGSLCSCDSDCIKFKQCCPDRNLHCDADEPTLNDASDPSTFSEENHAGVRWNRLVGGDTDQFSNNGVEDPEAGPVPQITSGYELSTVDVLDQISTEPTQDPDPLPLSTEAFSASTETQTTLPDTEKEADFNPSTLNPTESTDNPKDYQADDTNDTNLCSGRPVGAVTTLRNGTMVVFRGHYFWLVDRHMVPSPAQSITQVWGVPSPIDTAFTRCNCEGKTYIFKGPRYWRFENGLLDPHYPKVVQVGFDGLRGQITAALSVPQYQSRRESVYFFKRGGAVQKYSYQLGASPTCGRKVHNAVYTVRSRVVRRAVSLLGPSINIRTSWRGFPSTITAAVSVPSRTEREGYKYHVFSRSTSYNVRMGGERPVVPAPTANESPQSRDFFKCQKKV
ncbi:hypothetical protein CesoFtcFv8_004897 [Champsocephalus esox]|uniref:SMB domain-containing protein n=1 Tax=Champsocephalus esox TaxID=159716 RepID=A0AAN8CU13_9TELE|nr:hypothetical protein CesoFtcFv8_004897 [Champsocephalus esox]